jgi:hypothetical protein
LPITVTELTMDEVQMHGLLGRRVADRAARGGPV